MTFPIDKGSEFSFKTTLNANQILDKSHLFP